MNDIKIKFNGTELKPFSGTIDELNIEERNISLIEESIKKRILIIMANSPRALAGFIKDQRKVLYNDYFTYASKLPKSQRHGKSSLVLAQALNLLKYSDSIECFRPARFIPQLVKIDT